MTLTRQNASTDLLSQALDRLSRTPFATQSATHFDLGSEERRTPNERWKSSSIEGRGQAGLGHRLSRGGIASAPLRSALPRTGYSPAALADAGRVPRVTAPPPSACRRARLSCGSRGRVSTRITIRGIPVGQPPGSAANAAPFDTLVLGSRRGQLRPGVLAAPVPMPVTDAGYRWLILMASVPSKGIPRWRGARPRHRRPGVGAGITVPTSDRVLPSGPETVVKLALTSWTNPLDAEPGLRLVQVQLAAASAAPSAASCSSGRRFAAIILPVISTAKNGLVRNQA